MPFAISTLKEPLRFSIILFILKNVKIKYFKSAVFGRHAK